jgi:hypothetical protein
MAASCTHVASIVKGIKPRTKGCEDYVVVLLM